MTSIPVASASGVQLTGLTPGATYSVWSEGGPWYPTGNSSLPGAYEFALSEDGSSWSNPIGTSYDPWANYIGSPLSDTYKPTWSTARSNLDSVHVLITFVASGTSVWVRAGDNPANFGDNTGSLECEIGGGTLPFCQYGTSVQTSVVAGAIITVGLVDILIAAAGAPAFLAVVFDTFVGKTIWGGDLCAGLPPVMPQFTNDDFVGGVAVPNPASLGKFWQALQAIAWPYFCQCNAGPTGSPPPIGVPPVTVIAPPAAPTAPIHVDCDNSDVCTLLNQLMRQLSGMNQSIAQLRSDVTLIQRQKVPFAYVAHQLVTGLSGNGELSVQGILGLAVQLTTLPGRLGEETGDPIAYFDAGWVSIGTPDGWRRSAPIRHNPQWIDAEGDDTLIGYSLTPGVVANIQTFAREP